MIIQLSVKDFAIIKDLCVDFNQGLNIITGETGSGKSIIIEAISMALGSRADSDFVRTGCKKAVIQLIIDAPESAEPIILTREIYASGRSIGKINDETVTLAKLSAFCRKYVDIHGQYDNQALLNKENHIHILDTYDINGISQAKQTYFDIYESYLSSLNRLASLNKTLRENARKKDFMEFELKEISKINPVPGEYEEIKEKINILENSEKIYTSANDAYNKLYAGENSCSELLMKSLNELKNISHLSAQFDEMREIVEDCYYRIEEVSSSLSGFANSVDFSAEELDSLISRLDELEGLKIKYGGSIESVIEYKASLELALSSMENSDALEAELKEEIASKYVQVKELAENLSALRKEAAQKMEAEINRELGELNFKNSLFKINFNTLKNSNGQYEFSSEGFDDVEFLISANKGEALKPIAKIASGGEISRIMLAFKKVIGSYSSVPTFIFDEIDTGISGNAAEVVGMKLSRIAKEHQIICITHLPQIAVMGDHHYLIEKHSDEKETYTSVSEMDEKILVKEIARLSGSSELTENAVLNAEEIIALARVKKSSL